VMTCMFSDLTCAAECAREWSERGHSTRRAVHL